MIKLGLVGANGRMGLQIAQLIAAKPELYSLDIAITNDLTSIKPELQKLAKSISDDVTLLKHVDVVIDFSNPIASLLTLNQCLKCKIPLVIGTTGFDSSQKELITKASNTIPILFSPNMSLSVNILFKLTELVAHKLTHFETEIIETHHRYKKDAPSGTAIKLGETIAKARNINFEQHAKFTRHGINEARKPEDIGFAVIRGGDIVGKHDVLFINDGETLTLTSEINNRTSFAHGALVAASFLLNQSPRLYTMQDALSL